MKYFVLCSLLFFCGSLFAQKDVSLALQKPVEKGAAAISGEWRKLGNKVNVSFANSNMRYIQDRVPLTNKKTADTLTAWKGEKVHTQLLVWTGKKINNLRIESQKPKGKDGSLIETLPSVGFIGYVMTDEFATGCGHRKPEDFDSFLVADPINTALKETGLEHNRVQPVWISLKVPEITKPGVYETSISVHADNQLTRLKLFIKVLDKTLPPPALWSFNLDFWQHPAAIARVHDVKLWSDEHFNLMRPYYTMLADAGQKNITTSIVEEPWNHQTYDDFPSLITWTKKKDGSWEYDYTLFDKYVEFVMDCGIDQRINCYSMVPWKIQFPYFDEALGKRVVFTKEVGTPEYKEFWQAMLSDFRDHLKEKGWFSRTTIAMDERPMAAMKAVIELLKEVDPGWKIALAGEYHPEIEADIFEYCVASKWKFSPEILAARKSQKKLSTWYTCCVEKYPNGFTFSPPAEHVWIGWYTAAEDMDGYLRWAYNSWTKDPLEDSRFKTWPAGDTYQVYPGPQTSIRFEKLIEGIQDFEKISLLRREYKREGETAKLRELEDALSAFEIDKLHDITAEAMIKKAKHVIN